MGRSDRGTTARSGRLYGAAQALVGDHARAVDAVRAALTPIYDGLAHQELDAIPVARLKEVTEGRLRLGEVEKGDFRTVRQVLEAGPYRLRQIPGVGQQTAAQAVAAARQIADAVRETISVRIEVDRPDPLTTALVVALALLAEAGPQVRRAVGAAEALSGRLGPLLVEAKPASSRLRLFVTGKSRRERALAAVAEIREVTEQAEQESVPELLAQASVDLLRGPLSEMEAWVDFELRSADYYSLIAELSGRQPDPAAAEGFLPDEVAERVRGQSLDDTHRRVSLRGYQAFGARFMLAQRRMILGDEMGLGKTIQAIAAVAHLAAKGRSHFMVVCPASVLINWTREIENRSTLRVMPLHGPEREEAFADWTERGGVGVTTFGAPRARAGRDLVLFADVPEAAEVLVRLLLDVGDTAVARQTAEALARMGTVAALRLIALAVAEADGDQADRLQTGVQDALVGPEGVPDVAADCGKPARDHEGAVRRGAAEISTWTDDTMC